MKRFQNILLVLDFNSKNNNALQRAIDLAERNKAKLTIIDVIEEVPSVVKLIFQKRHNRDPESDEFEERKTHLEALIDPFKDRLANLSFEVLKGQGFIEVIRRVQSHHHDLVITPSQNSTQIKSHIFGSTNMHLMRKCPCPVWIVKSEFEGSYLNILAAIK